MARRGRSTETGFNGRAFWSSNENRYTVIALEDTARRRITQNAIDTGAFDTAEVADRGAQTVDGKSAEIVHVTPRGGIPADLAIDPATGAYLRFTLEPDDRYQRAVTRILGYTEIAPGVRVPSAYAGEHGGDTWRFVSGKVRAVSDDDLRAPSPAPRWSFGNDTPPIEIARGTFAGHAVYVHASINGHPGRFLLDSGAGQILLYHPYVDKIGLTMLGKTGFSGINGRTVEARYGRADTIAFGDNVLSNVVLGIAPPDDQNTIADGIIGFDVLAGAVVHVDLAHETIAFGDPASVEPSVAKGAFAFPVNLADNTPEVVVNVGKVATRATLDTGNALFVALSDNLKTSGRLVALEHSTLFSSGVDGIQQEPDSCYLLNEMSVGPYRYRNPTVCLSKEQVYGRDGGLIGFDFLRHFNWTFDYTRSHVVLTPNGL
ncbi:MAG TPA: aspartyl protease family protein [Candidatus Elarobacter sp.]|nr:aspartyl protease family protein [Candidatus Elarobacter sp.]